MDASDDSSCAPITINSVLNDEGQADWTLENGRK